jgi:hypothetical protein
VILTLAFAASSVVDLNAIERAEGNRPAQAVQIGRVLLRTTWPAQVLKIRVDGAGAHAVAGLVLSGVKFHRRLDPAAFTAEVVALVAMTFASSYVDEVDVWATVPLPYARQQPVNGEYLIPTERTVYGVTILRSEAATFAARLGRGDDVFWDPAWRRTLGASARSRESQGSARIEGQS